MAGDPADILLQPKVGDIGLLEFETGDKAIEIGYQTTMKMKRLILEEMYHLALRQTNAPQPN